ncbi:hypothetical protein [Hydrogenophaga sp.]|nr:hypothetical protein [Hydrogenophaga sp.]MDO9436726.1 hypothetical protein [Hydrogenophaga sp.]
MTSAIATPFRSSTIPTPDITAVGTTLRIVAHVAYRADYVPFVRRSRP